MREERRCVFLCAAGAGWQCVCSSRGVMWRLAKLLVVKCHRCGACAEIQVGKKTAHEQAGLLPTVSHAPPKVQIAAPGSKWTPPRRGLSARQTQRENCVNHDKEP